MSKTPDEIWEEDLLERRGEAAALIGFIESVDSRNLLRSRIGAYTIAVDATYGLGKTFFLRRLAEELALNHPVAFVDAWTDDLADEPLIALLATLKVAIEPLRDAGATAAQWQSFLRMSGKVAGLVTLGLLKRGAGLLVTASAVEALEAALKELTEGAREAVGTGLADTANATIDAIEDGLKAGAGQLEERIREFEAGRVAIEQMKASLCSLVSTLKASGRHPPIVIIIDELDRCRPSYAIKLLEEIKHLFDVPGIVFVFGVHLDQLQRSVSHSYGNSFDGRAYLQRFMNRTYTLKTPENHRIINLFVDKCRISDDDFYRLNRTTTNGVRRTASISDIINIYSSQFHLTPRELLSLFDILEVSIQVAGGRKLIFPYLIPLIVARLRGASPIDLSWDHEKTFFLIGPDEHPVSALSLFQAISGLKDLGDRRIIELCDDDEYAYNIAYQNVVEDSNVGSSLADFRRYEELLDTVCRFG